MDDDKTLEIVDIREFKDEDIPEEFVGGNKYIQEQIKENKDE